MKYGTSLYHLSDYFLPLKYTTLNISSDEETTIFFFLVTSKYRPLMGQDEYSSAELSLKLTSPHYFRMKLLSTYHAFLPRPHINHY